MARAHRHRRITWLTFRLSVDITGRPRASRTHPRAVPEARPQKLPARTAEPHGADHWWAAQALVQTVPQAVWGMN